MNKELYSFCDWNVRLINNIRLQILLLKPSPMHSDGVNARYWSKKISCSVSTKLNDMNIRRRFNLFSWSCNCFWRQNLINFNLVLLFFLFFFCKQQNLKANTLQLCTVIFYRQMFWRVLSSAVHHFLWWQANDVSASLGLISFLAALISVGSHHHLYLPKLVCFCDNI